MDIPLQRYLRKTPASLVRIHNGARLERAIDAALDDAHPAEEEDHGKFWEELSADLNDHAHQMEEHARRARKLAETVRITKIVKKVPGRTVPNSTHYVQVTTKRSDRPF